MSFQSSIVDGAEVARLDRPEAGQPRDPGPHAGRGIRDPVDQQLPLLHRFIEAGHVAARQRRPGRSGPGARVPRGRSRSRSRSPNAASSSGLIAWSARQVSSSRVSVPGRWVIAVTSPAAPSANTMTIASQSARVGRSCLTRPGRIRAPLAGRAGIRAPHSSAAARTRTRARRRSSGPMLSSRSWRSWSVATGKGSRSALADARDERDQWHRHRQDDALLAERGEDLGGDLAVGPVARAAELEACARSCRAARGTRPRCARGRRRRTAGSARGPGPGTGITPGERRASSAIRLKKPSPSPHSRLGLRIVQSRPLRADDRLALRLRAGVVQARDRRRRRSRRLVDEPANAGRLGCFDDVARAVGVDAPEVAAAVEVARDGDEMDDGVDRARPRPNAAGSEIGSRDVAERDADSHPVGVRRGARACGRRPGGSGTSATTPWPAIEQRGKDVAADEPVRAGQQDRGQGSSEWR